MSKPKRVPSYSKHASGNARVRINGRDVYLGPYGSPESHEKYNRIISEYLSGQYAPTDLSARMTIGELVARYLLYAEGRYRKHGRQTGELSAIQTALRPLVKLYRSSYADEFNAMALVLVRTHMIGLRWVRKDINTHVGRIRTMFKWAHRYLNLDQTVSHSLSTLPGLRLGEQDVAESVPVKPVALEVIRRTQRYLSPMVADMIEVQLLTGMRPGEIILLRPKHIEMNGQYWTYRPEENKLEHFGIPREVEIGPQAQEIIRNYLPASVDAYCFKPKRGLLHYNVFSYRRAIHRACDRAWPAPGMLARQDGEKVREWKARLEFTGLADELARWQSQHRWSPNRIRHTAGTMIREAFSLEIAAAVLGHTKVSTTEIYAEINRRTARQAIREMG